jgi:hypothetical protein
MKKTFKILVLLIGMLCVSFQFSLAETHLSEGLDEILAGMSEFEENYEKGQWHQARKAVEKINWELKGFFEKIQRDDLAQEKKMLSRDIYNLRGSIREKNTAQTETNYIRFQVSFFNFMSNFDYEVHPVLAIIDKYINEEAVEAAAEKDFKNVVSEMREVGNLIKLAQPLLTDKGFTEKEFADFRSKIVAVIKAGKEKDAKQVNEKLKEVQEAFKSIMGLFT